MISSVTTVVSTIVSSSTVGDVIGSLGVAAVITLIITLAIRELANHGIVRFKTFSKNLGIIILPLLFVFTFILSITCFGFIV
jgi:hypothetical protein